MGNAKAIDVAAVTKSFRVLVTRLAQHAYFRADENDDLHYYRREKSLDVEDLWIDYWDRRYRYAYLSAFYDLPPLLREEAAIRSMPGDAAEIFLQALAPFKKSGTAPPAKVNLKELTWFDGNADRKLVEKSPVEIKLAIKNDRPPPRARNAKKATASDLVTLRSVCGVAVGGMYDDALAAFGKPDRHPAYDEIFFPQWNRVGLWMGVTIPGRVIQWIEVHYDAEDFRADLEARKNTTILPATWRTAEGIGNGSTRDAIVKAFGRPKKEGMFTKGRRPILQVSYGKTVFALHAGKLCQIHMSR